MNKFCYSAGEIKIAKTQCGLCIFQIDGNNEKCQKYEEKPKEVVLDECKCPYLQSLNHTAFPECE